MRKFGFRVAVVAACCFGSVVQVQAGSLDGPNSAVFDRIYSADYLKKNPNQEVAGIKFEKMQKSGDQNTQSDQDAAVEFNLEVKFRDSKNPYVAAGSCFPGEEGQMDCRIDCNGTGFFIKPESNGSILFMNVEGAELNGCSDANLKSRTMKTSPDYSVYRLDPAKS